jgi:5-formyltetrahydrofolate cyclo-ligase
MARLAAVPDADPDAPRPARSRRSAADGRPLYQQVLEAVEALAMRTELGDPSPLPPEARLMERFGVSRGTVRRAIEELVREGLLRIEPGRGTFVDQATKVRWLVWDRLLEVSVPDSRFHLDLARFVPDFDGRAAAEATLLALPSVAAATTVFLAPDNPLEGARRAVLDAGKRIVVPTFGLRRGMVLVDGAAITPADRALAATLDGMERFGTTIDLDGLRALGTVDLVVTGAVAMTARGLHFGGGDGYFDFEWALMRHLNLVSSITPVIAVVHDSQVLDADIRPGAHDAVADTIITPTRTITCSPALPKPDGILWDELHASGDDSIGYVRELRARLHPDVLPVHTRRGVRR